jgi:hypothetical protein
MTAKKSLYQILGVPRDATPEKIGLAHEIPSAGATCRPARAAAVRPQSSGA